VFTGLIEACGRVVSSRRVGQSIRLCISYGAPVKELEIGDSISVNGVCLTVTGVENGRFWADVMPETYRHTNLPDLRSNDPVNLERALRVTDRLAGHIVTGHVDGIGVIRTMAKEGVSRRLEIGVEPRMMESVVRKGSIAVDGISLTVAECGRDWFAVGIIPHTLTSTNLKAKRAGDRVNIEVDILAKYVARFLSGPVDSSNQLGKSTGDRVHVQETEPEGVPSILSVETLRRAGF